MAEIWQLGCPEEVGPGNPLLQRAARLIRDGEVIAIPTDTVYGLAADALNERAVDAIYEIKGRERMAPILLLVDGLAMARSLMAVEPPQFSSLAGRFWPGPLTLVVPAAERVPSGITGGGGTVGLRWPAARIPLALIQTVGGPITATSANRSGEPDCASAAEVQAAIGDRIPAILDTTLAPSGSAVRPSTVVSLAGSVPRLLREGPISKKELLDLLPDLA